MSKGKRVLFVIVLILFISLSLFITFNSIARNTFEFEWQENIGDIENLNGYVFYGFSGNTSTKSIAVDFVRDKDGNTPEADKSIIGIDAFTIVSDEYVEFITIGKDVQFVSEQAFYYCKKLKAVFVEEGNQYYTSIDGVLYTKDMKTLVLHPICNSQWLVEEGKAESNDTYKIPDGVEVIGGYSFYKNDSLVNLEMPTTVKVIGDMAFFGCGNMKNFLLHEGVETIGNDSFSYCGNMKPILYIPKTVKSIGHHAYFSCSGITEVYIGAESEDDLNAGDGWLPKSLNNGILNVTPEPLYGKTYEDALEYLELYENQQVAEEV